MLGARPKSLSASGPSTPPATLDQGGVSPRGLIWLVSEHQAISASQAEDGAGAITIQFQVQNFTWKVNRVHVSTDSTTPTTATVYSGDTNPQNAKDSTASGNDDTADEVNPIIVPAGSALIIQWTGASSGAVGSVNLQYEVGNYQQGPVVGAG